MAGEGSGSVIATWSSKDGGGGCAAAAAAAAAGTGRVGGNVVVSVGAFVVSCVDDAKDGGWIEEDEDDEKGRDGCEDVVVGVVVVVV